MLSVSDELAIRGDLGQVYECFWNPRFWTEITRHVKQVHMLEETGTFQRFTMEVESGGKVYRTESKRFGVPCEEIRYEQLQPPPFLTRHTGRWTFRPMATGIVVQLVHNVDIDEVKAAEYLGTKSLPEAEQRIGAALKTNGLMTMSAVKQWVEGPGSL